eukprot:scaffold24398_cov133-Isochrysis_galbana.AAC.1
MEHPPADARAAPSASEPNDTVMDIHESPPRPPRNVGQPDQTSLRIYIKLIHSPLEGKSRAMRT